MKKFTLIFLVAVLSVGLAFGQSINVTGTVKGDDGNPLPGVTVTVKGTHIGALTDSKGKYSISAPASGTLSFSFVGMNPQDVVIGSRNVVNVSLTSSVDSIDEVVVVAYGTQKRSSITGSIGTMKAAQLEDRQAANVTKVLEGNIAGVQAVVSSGQPGTSAAIRIRGVGSISASNNPLYVVDGVPYDDGIESVNSADIESISVLKDASANAIYGARGANGVVLITTKRGTTSEAVVSVDMKLGVNSRGTPQYNVITDPGQYYESYYTNFYNSRYYAGLSVGDSHAYARNTLTSPQGLGYQVFTVPNGEALVGTNFKMNPNAKLGYSDGTYFYTPDNWYDETFNNNNLRQEYNVSISGKTEKMNYMLSAGYLNDTGIVTNSGFERYTARIKADYQAKKWLKVGANVGLTSSDSQFPSEADAGWGSSGNIFFAANMIAPIYPMYVRNADGSIKKDDKGMTVYDNGVTTNSSRPFLGTAAPNQTIVLNKQRDIKDVLTSKWFANVDLYEGLQFMATIGFNLANSRYTYLNNPYYGAFAGKGRVEVNNNRTRGLNQQYMFTYKNTFCDNHSIDILAGFESYNLKKQYSEIANTDIYNPNVPEIGNTTGITPKVDSYTNEYTTLGFLGRVQYDYMDKYMLSASYRRDASSVFHPDHRWGNFGSVGAAWMVNKEGFFNADWVDMLKVKVSYGIQGNDDMGRESRTWAWYAYQDIYKIASSNGMPSVGFSSKGNPELTWESSHSFNTGVDFSLFNGRLSGTVEYFSRLTSDLLYLQPVPNVLGYRDVPMNVGKMRNAGVEIDLNGVLLSKKNVVISMFLNATNSKNKIIEMSETANKTGGLKTGTSIMKEGGSVYDSYLVRWAGVDKNSGKQLYYIDPDNGNWNTTTTFSSAKQSVIGTTLPKVYGGFGLNAKLYGFDVSTTIAYQLGGRMFDFSYMQMMQPGSSGRGQNLHIDILKSWTENNRNASVPRLNFADSGNQDFTDRFLVSSNFLSINNVTVGYTLPEKWAKKLMISRLRIYAVGDNLSFASTRRGFDPRLNTLGLNGNTGATGAGNFQYSALRTISGGLSFAF